MPLTIRPADPGDAPRIAALITLAYRVEDFFIDGDRTDAAGVAASMRHGEFLLLEEDDGAVCGAVYVEARGAQGYFGMLSIDPAQQRKGLGARLVAAAEQWCRQTGCREVEIEVVSLRTELPPFYARLGYAETGARPFPDQHKSRLPCHFIVMSKALGGSL